MFILDKENAMIDPDEYVREDKEEVHPNEKIEDIPREDGIKQKEENK